MILEDGCAMILTTQRANRDDAWKDEKGRSLATLAIPFRGGFAEAEEEIGKLERLAGEVKVISGHGNNVHTNPPEGRAGKRLKYTWRFVGARSHMAEFIKKILCS